MVRERCSSCDTVFYTPMTVGPEQRDWRSSKLGPSRCWHTTAVLFPFADFGRKAVKSTQTASDVITWGNLHLYKNWPVFAYLGCVLITSEWHKSGICRLGGKFLCLRSSDFRPLVGNLSHTTKARQEARNSLNSALLHPLLPWKPADRKCTAVLQFPHLISQPQPIFSSGVSKLTHESAGTFEVLACGGVLRWLTLTRACWLIPPSRPDCCPGWRLPPAGTCVGLAVFVLWEGGCSFKQRTCFQCGSVDQVDDQENWFTVSDRCAHKGVFSFDNTHNNIHIIITKSCFFCVCVCVLRWRSKPNWPISFFFFNVHKHSC